MAEPPREYLVESFDKVHGDHYEVRDPLGEGAAGFTFRGFDRRRSVEVCLKFYLNGKADRGADRDWRITSTIKHELVADTFSVEHFDYGGAEPAVVLVSRFIPGRNLERVLRSIEDEPEADRRPLLRTVVARLGVSLDSAVQVLHARGVGHGDLHGRNVIVSPADRNDDVIGGSPWRPVLIDFDNATFRRAPEDGEQARIEKDVRSIRRLLGSMTYGSAWHDELTGLLQECPTTRDEGFALGAALTFLDHVDNVDPSYFDEGTISVALRSLLAQRTAGAPYGAYLAEMIKRVAERVGCHDLYVAAHDAMKKRILEDRSYPGISVSMTQTDARFAATLKALIGQA